MHASFSMTHAVIFSVTAVIGWLPIEGRAQVGTCEPATAEAYLDVNNVRARIFGNGALFWRGHPNVYEVPVGSGLQSMFVGSLWLGGLVSDELRVAASRYGPWEFWPGPLDDDGTPLADCSSYDRLWKVSRRDVASFEAGGDPTADLRDWPTGLGAPTMDAGGTRIDLSDQPLSVRSSRVIDLGAGERPLFTGDQMVWWIMNDRSGMRSGQDLESIGVEVHGTAFAFEPGGEHVGNATFYRYRIRYRGDASLDSAFVGLHSDVDLGDFSDDYVGSDTTLGLGYAYNGDNFDGESQGYGKAPPAIGVDIVRGPVVPSPGDSAWLDGRRVAGLRNLSATSMMNFYGGGGPSGDPGSSQDYYYHLQGRWKDGSRKTEGGNGYNTGGGEVSFSFPGDPVTATFWSENNADGSGGVNTPTDRRFTTSSGPFRIEPGAEQEVTFAIVWARGESNLDSVTRLREASRQVQRVVDGDYRVPPPPDPPTVDATAARGQAVLTWTNDANSNNYLDSYRHYDPFADGTYLLEGYNVFQFDSANDDIGRLIAVYDIDNGVRQVIEGPFRLEQLTAARGTDSGLRHYHIVDGLTNYATYHFGVQAYAYQPGGFPKIRKSSTTRVVVTPFKSTVAASDSALAVWRGTDAPDIVVNVDSPIEFSATVDVVNPYATTGGTYTLRPDSSSCWPGGIQCQVLQVLAADGREVTRLDFEGLNAHPATIGFDGLSLTARLDGVSIFRGFLAVSNAAGVLDPPEYAAFAFNNSGFPQRGPSGRPDTGRQQSNGSAWGVHSNPGSLFFGSIEDPDSFLGIVLAQGALRQSLAAYDYEIRFTARGGRAWRDRDGGDFIDVPFELWNVGVDTPNDVSDDFRMIPAVCESACGHSGQQSAFDIAGDHPISGGDNDPFTDPFSWYEPADTSPGEAGYDAFFAGTSAVGAEVMRDMVLVNWNGGVSPPYNAALPETGSTFRIETLKGLQNGVDYTFDTGAFGARQPDEHDRIAALRDVGIVPNPYRGVSAYQTSLDAAEVRFTNVPAGATVRVFALNGSLVRTLSQESDGVLRWDLLNEAGRSLASAMYLVHVEVPDVGKRVLKFGVQRLASGDE